MKTPRENELRNLYWKLFDEKIIISNFDTNKMICVLYQSEVNFKVDFHLSVYRQKREKRTGHTGKNHFHLNKHPQEK